MQLFSNLTVLFVWTAQHLDDLPSSFSGLLVVLVIGVLGRLVGRPTPMGTSVDNDARSHDTRHQEKNAQDRHETGSGRIIMVRILLANRIELFLIAGLGIGMVAVRLKKKEQLVSLFGSS